MDVSPAQSGAVFPNLWEDFPDMRRMQHQSHVRKEEKAMCNEQLVGSIQASSSASEALSCLDHFESLSPLHELLARSMQNHQIGPQALARAIDVERSTVYRLLSGDRLTTRNVLLRIAIVLNLSLDETQTLLRNSQRAELYELVRRDALIIFSMSNGLSLEQTEAELLRKGEASLYERT